MLELAETGTQFVKMSFGYQTVVEHDLTLTQQSSGESRVVVYLS